LLTDREASCRRKSMNLRAKQLLIALLGFVFLASLLFVQWMEVARKQQEAGLAVRHVSIPASSKACVECHDNLSPGIIDHWKGSTHAVKGVGCVECHQADEKDADSFHHWGHTIATVVTPLDCSRCHPKEFKEFEHSHHAKAGNILASLDNFLAETVEGSREPFNPHSPTPGMQVDMVNGMASVNTGCKQCHGSKVALMATDGSEITFEDLQPDDKGQPTNLEAVARIKKDESNQPVLHSATWPNTGIGRLNLDGSLGSCSACHSRHDFSPRRARQPENCGKCHLGPDHPQKEIYEESKHGVAFRDLREHMNLDAHKWVLGEDYTQAPTCATCHMSAHSRGGEVTHDPGERISWTNRPPISLMMDTDINHGVIKETDPTERQKLIDDSWQNKRDRMKQVCLHCHTTNYVNGFYKQYDDFVINYNEKFAKPGTKIMAVLKEGGLLTKVQFDEEIEWTWFYLWHHEGRRARHGASMMAPDYAHWHGMFEVAERFYQELIPQAREIAEHAAAEGKTEAAEAVEKAIDDILSRPEHQWFEKGDPPPTEEATTSPQEADLQQPIRLSRNAVGQTNQPAQP
jgi:hydroxylamine dehydrogenase